MVKRTFRIVQLPNGPCTLGSSKIVGTRRDVAYANLALLLVSFVMGCGLVYGEFRGLHHLLILLRRDIR
jgi:hypothetical protein